MNALPRTLVALALASTVSACDPYDDGDWPVFHAVIEGEIVLADSSLYTGSMFINCGLGAFGPSFTTATPGRYRFEMAQSYLTILEKELCEVTVGTPPIAMGSDSVIFSETRAAAATTIIDVVEP